MARTFKRKAREAATVSGFQGTEQGGPNHAMSSANSRHPGDVAILFSRALRPRSPSPRTSRCRSSSPRQHDSRGPRDPPMPWGLREGEMTCRSTRLSEGSAAATTSTSLDAFSSSVCQNAVSEPKIAIVDRPWAASFGPCTAPNNSISRPSSGGTTHTSLAITRQGQKLGAANTLRTA
jgi:hypothetical protein